MNKKLLTVAMVGASILVLPFAAQAGEIVLEGELHGSVGAIDDGDTTSFEIGSHQSELAISGSTEITPEVNGIFALATGVALDGEGGSDGFFGSRDTYVGLQSDQYGMLRAGIIDTAYEDADDEMEDFNDGGSAFAIDPRPDGISDWKAIMHSLPGGGEDGGPGGSDDVFDVRAANSLEYATPRIAGFLGRLSYVGSSIESEANGEQIADGLKRPTGVDDNGADGISTSLNYVFGDFGITYAYERQDYNGQNAGRIFAGNVIDTIGNPAAHNVILQYGNDAGLRLGASWETIDMDAVDMDGNSGYERDAWYLMAAQEFGDNLAYAKYAQADDLDAVSESGAIFFALGVQHAITDNFQMYLEYAQTSNDDNATYAFDSGGTGIGVAAAGEDVRGLNLGVIYAFEASL